MRVECSECTEYTEAFIKEFEPFFELPDSYEVVVTSSLEVYTDYLLSFGIDMVPIKALSEVSVIAYPGRPILVFVPSGRTVTDIDRSTIAFVLAMAVYQTSGEALLHDVSFRAARHTPNTLFYTDTISEKLRAMVQTSIVMPLDMRFCLLFLKCRGYRATLRYCRPYVERYIMEVRSSASSAIDHLSAKMGSVDRRSLQTIHSLIESLLHDVEDVVMYGTYVELCRSSAVCKIVDRFSERIEQSKQLMKYLLETYIKKPLDRVVRGVDVEIENIDATLVRGVVLIDVDGSEAGYKKMFM